MCIMKKNLFISKLLNGALIHLALISVSALIISCSSEADEIDTKQPEEPKTAEMIDVNLGFGGDPISISESPLSRAGETKKKIYGINVYYREGSNGDYKNYAYGLFDNVADMKISLISKYTYYFECTIVQDDKDELYVNNDGYYYPFCSSYYGVKLENKFYVSTTSSTYLNRIQYGFSRVKSGDKEYPCTDRLYGELENYTPTDGGTAIINMKRTAFGIKLVVTPPADGNLEIKFGSYLSEVVSSSDATKTIETLCTFSNVYDCWKQQEDYTQNFSLNLTWKRANGATQTFNKTITMKRNVKTTVNVSVAGATGDSSIGINEENTAMGTATVDASFNGGNSGDNNVNPS